MPNYHLVATFQFTFITIWILTQSTTLNAQGLALAEQFSKKAGEFYLQSKWDSAEIYYQKSADAYQRDGNMMESWSQRVNLIDLYSAQNRMELVKPTIDSLLLIIPEKDTAYNNLRSKLYWKLGTYYEMISSLEKASYYTEFAISIQEKTQDPDSTILSDMYLDLGILYQHDKDYPMALKHYQESLRLRKNDQEPLALANIHNSLAVAYFYLRNYNKALEEYQASLSYYYQILNPEHPKVAVSYNNLAFVHMQMGNYDSSIFYHRKALRIRLYKLPENHPQTVSSYNGIGMVYTVNKQYDSAEFYFDKCMELLKSHDSENFNYFLSRVVYNLCQLNFRREQYSESLKYVDQAVALNIPSHELTDSIYSEIKNLADLVDLMQFKIKIMAELYKQDSIPNHLDIGLKAFEDLQKLSTYYFGNIKFVDSQLQVIQILEQAYPRGIAMSYEKYSKSDDYVQKEVLVKKIFHDMEYYKSNLLRRNVFKTKHLEISRLSDELLERERELRAEIAYMKSNATFREEELFEKERKYEKLIRRIEKEDPAFYELKFKSFVPLLADAIDYSRRHNKIILEYFLSKEALYCVFLDEEDVRLTKIDIDSTFDTTMDKFYHELSLAGENHDKKGYRGNDLYNLLLGSFDNEIQGRDVVIVPDGVLHQIPFEVLQNNESNYLIHGSNISYANSVALLVKSGDFKRNTNPIRVLAFAPEYDLELNRNELIRGDNLTKLRWTNNEIAVINNSFETNEVVGKKATEEIFKEYIKDYNIIHFAGHGIVDDDNPLRSRLAFSFDNNDSLKNPYLFTQELMGMEIPADLVVLSACKTGVGGNVDGEGILSLARGFFYAGSKSVVMSYWSVDDESTSELMSFFYNNLYDGMTKSEALRQAKLEFLKTAPPEKQHPFYWGAFVVIGDDSPLFQPSHLWALPIVLSAFLLLLWVSGHLKKTI